MVRIRLRRVGSKGQPSYRIVAADKESPRDGRFLEILGFYNPRTAPATIEVKEDRVFDWMSKGAQPTESVAQLFKTNGLLDRYSQFKTGENVETQSTEVEKTIGESVETPKAEVEKTVGETVETLNTEDEETVGENVETLNTEAEETIKGKPVKGKPVKGKPVKEKPVKEKPVKEKPVKEKPVKPKARKKSED